MRLVPEIGLVIRYDFPWWNEQLAGAKFESRDRPVAIILVVSAKENAGSRVIVCPITHSPPRVGQDAVEISSKIAAHLGLDGDRMWIKTDIVNEFA
jgi:uncharacterized protein YifN (PemK superfamily)